MGKVVLTPKFRAAFVHVFEPRKQQNDDGSVSEKYELVMIFDKEAQETPEFKAIKAAANDVAKAKWPNGVPKSAKSPFKSAGDFENDSGERYAGFEDDDLVAIRASTKKKPGIIDRNRKRLEEPGDFYSGCYARAQIDVYAYAIQGKSKGVTLALENLQKLGDGDALGSARSKPEDVFDAMDDQSDVSETEDDDVPF